MGELPKFERRERLSPSAQRYLGFVLELKARNMDHWRDRQTARLLSMSRATLIRARAECEEENFVLVQRVPGRPVRVQFSRWVLEALVAGFETPPVRKRYTPVRKCDTNTPLDSTPSKTYDLPFPDAVTRGDLPALLRVPGQERKAGEVPTMKRPEAPAVGRLSREARRELQGGLLRQVQEADRAQEGRTKPPVDKEPWGRSQEVAPLEAGYHEERGRIHGPHAPENGRGFTVGEQARRHHEAERERQRKQAELPGLRPVEERPRQAPPAVRLPLDPDKIPAGLRKFAHVQGILGALRDRS